MSFLRGWILLFSLLSGTTPVSQTVSFLPQVQAFVSGAGEPTSICSTCLATADFNGDGHMDIVYSGFEGLPQVGVLLGNGDGTFRPGFIFDILHLPIGAPLAIGDFNGDGKPDVGFSTGVFLGNGDGTFTDEVLFPASAVSDFWPDGTFNMGKRFVLSADLNHDGKQDLIYGTTILLSQGDGTFRLGPSAIDGNVQLISDFNHDGNADVLLATESGQLMVALGHGDGTFGPDLALSASLKLPVQSGDFNGDGKIDIAGTSIDGTAIVVLPGRGDGTFAASVVTSGITDPIFASGDFNADGKLDLVVGDAVLAGNGDGTFRFPIFVGTPTNSCVPMPNLSGLGCDYMHYATAVGDFNGDGRPDLAFGYDVAGYQNRSEFSVSVLLNDSPGDGFTAVGVSAASGTWPVGPGSLVSAYGVNLAATTETGSATGPPSLTLGGIQVLVSGRPARLLYVSPTQINYVLPDVGPFAYVAIQRAGSPYVPEGVYVPIRTIAPGLFSVSGGIAAATAVKIADSGAQVAVPVVSCDGAACTAVPIDLSGGAVYLSLYGTGFAQASTSNANCTIAGRVLPLTYAGPQGPSAGLDQLNLLLPKALAGTGATSILCSFAAQGTSPATMTNSVKLNIR
jgi:uncharacterized protein (TIGR03437 family)